MECYPTLKNGSRIAVEFIPHATVCENREFLLCLRHFVGRRLSKINLSLLFALRYAIMCLNALF